MGYLLFRGIIGTSIGLVGWLCVICLFGDILMHSEIHPGLPWRINPDLVLAGPGFLILARWLFRFGHDVVLGIFKRGRMREQQDAFPRRGQ